MFNYSAAILLLIKVYCALSWLYYLYLFIVYSREEGEQVGNGLFQGQTQTQTFAVTFGYMGRLLNPAPHFPFLNQTGKECGHRHWLCCDRIYCIKYYCEAANGPEDSPIMLLV